MSRLLHGEGLLVTAMIGSTVGLSAIYAYGTQFEKDIVINKKYERIKGSKNSTSQIFMVSDSENNHYRVSKSVWFWQWYSTEMWSDMEEYKEYHVKGYGIRFGPLGTYPNIYNIKRKD